MAGDICLVIGRNNQSTYFCKTGCSAGTLQLMTKRPVLIDEFLLGEQASPSEISTILDAYSNTLEVESHFLIVCNKENTVRILQGVCIMMSETYFYNEYYGS